MNARRHTIPPITEEREAEIQRRIASDPDAPELTDDELARGGRAKDVLPADIFAALPRPRGRPPGTTKADVKESVTMRLSRDTVAAFRATGRGWQTRMSELLDREARKLGK